MKIKDVIKNSALLIGKQNVLTYLENDVTDGATLATVNNMTALINLVINELACTYVPMVKSEMQVAESSKIYYTALSERPLRILSVTDKRGNDILKQSTPEYVVVNGNGAVIEYEFLPPNFGLEDEFNFSNAQITERILSYGLSAEVCISEGRFDEAVTWHERYVQEISMILTPKNAFLKQRRWV